MGELGRRLAMEICNFCRLNFEGFDRQSVARDGSMSAKKEARKGNWTKICPFADDKPFAIFPIRSSGWTRFAPPASPLAPEPPDDASLLRYQKGHRNASPNGDFLIPCRERNGEKPSVIPSHPMLNWRPTSRATSKRLENDHVRCRNYAGAQHRFCCRECLTKRLALPPRTSIVPQSTCPLGKRNTD